MAQYYSVCNVKLGKKSFGFFFLIGLYHLSNGKLIYTYFLEDYWACTSNMEMLEHLYGAILWQLNILFSE